jgi:hypothetical protein
MVESWKVLSLSPRSYREERCGDVQSRAVKLFYCWNCTSIMSIIFTTKKSLKFSQNISFYLFEWQKLIEGRIVKNQNEFIEYGLKFWNKNIYSYLIL